MAYVGGMWFIISSLVKNGRSILSANTKTLNYAYSRPIGQDLEGGEQEALSKKEKVQKMLDQILTDEQKIKLA
jgi:hypothetical protein